MPRPIVSVPGARCVALLAAPVSLAAQDRKGGARAGLELNPLKEIAS
jgi:hypothetical protein